MELGLREWLIIGGAIVVLLIVLDGWRRMRGSGNRLKMKIDKSFSDLPDIPEASFNPELPGGGARVVGQPGESDVDTDSRREPVFGNDELDLSPPRTVKPPVNRRESHKPETHKLDTQETATHNAGRFTSDARQPWNNQPATPAFSSDENDPLFAASDRFPPHHDGPSFDEMDEGISAVRVVRKPESNPLTDMTGNVEPERAVDPVVEDNVASDDDIPVVQHVVDKPEPEPVAETKAYTESDRPAQPVAVENADLFAAADESDAAEPSEEIESEEVQAELTYADEDEDDLIDSLPEGFRSDPASETSVEDEEHEFDYTRPVSELMRPVRDDKSELKQTAMELPERQESIFSLIDEPSDNEDNTGSDKAAPDSVRDNRFSKSEPGQKERSTHFSALDDDQPDLAAGLFASDQSDADDPFDIPLMAPSAQSAKTSQSENAEKPVKPSKPEKTVSNVAEKEAEEDSAIGIKGQSLQKIPEADKVLVISVVASEGGDSFSGRSLLQILLACGMRYGDMKIFHRYEDGIDQGAIQFSMTNALEPGFFDIDTMDSMATRGVTFFMSMEEPRDVMNAYECMLATADAVAKNLHGVLLDENRSTMRDQTKEHYRERIRKFEMRKLKKTTTA